MRRKFAVVGLPVNSAGSQLLENTTPSVPAGRDGGRTGLVSVPFAAAAKDVQTVAASRSGGMIRTTRRPSSRLTSSSSSQRSPRALPTTRQANRHRSSITDTSRCHRSSSTYLRAAPNRGSRSPGCPRAMTGPASLSARHRISSNRHSRRSVQKLGFNTRKVRRRVCRLWSDSSSGAGWSSLAKARR